MEAVKNLEGARLPVLTPNLKVGKKSLGKPFFLDGMFMNFNF